MSSASVGLKLHVLGSFKKLVRHYPVGEGGGRGCRTGVGVRFLVQYLNDDDNDNHFVYPRISE